MKNSTAAALELLSRAEKIGLLTHVDGDGDAFGSILGFERVLKQMGKNVVIFSDEDYPPEIRQLNDNNSDQPVTEYEDIDLLVCLDFNSKNRAALPEIITNARNTETPVLVIDHHPIGDLQNVADVYLNKLTSSTSELVFELVKAWTYKIDSKTADFLLFGLETDTSSLSNAGTTESSYKAASELLNLGAKVKPVIEAMRRRTVPSAKMVGRALERLHLNSKYNLAVTYVTRRDVEELGLDEATVNSGLANYLDQVKEAHNIIVFAETKEGGIKASMRSNRSGANVGSLAEFLGGGGHKLAAGFNFEGEIEKLIK